MANTLTSAKLDEVHTIKEIATDDEGIKDFLFSLGCYEGESITVVSIISGQYVITVKDARYSIDKDLADCIFI